MGRGVGSIGPGQACHWLEVALGLGGVFIRVETEQRGAQACGGKTEGKPAGNYHPTWSALPDS